MLHIFFKQPECLSEVHLRFKMKEIQLHERSLQSQPADQEIVKITSLIFHNLPAVIL